MKRAPQAFAKVIRCDHCLRLGFSKLLRDDTFNLPWPGYIGSNYESTRVLLVGQNPGTSPDRFSVQDREFADAQVALRDNVNARAYGKVKSILDRIMPTWPIVDNYFPLSECGLSLDDIANINVVRCRTVENATPSTKIARACVDKHFVQWLDWLRPSVVVCIGKWAHDNVGHLLQERGIPHAFVNRRRSLSSAERQSNRQQVVALVRKIILGESTYRQKSSANEGQAPNYAQAPIKGPRQRPLARGSARTRRSRVDILMDNRQQGLNRRSTMNAEGYIALLLELGYERRMPNDAKLLRHSRTNMPRLYFNRNRDGVYFVGYKAENQYFHPAHWTWLVPQKGKDDKPNLITIVPKSGREREAFAELLK